MFESRGRLENGCLVLWVVFLSAGLILGVNSALLIPIALACVAGSFWLARGEWDYRMLLDSRVTRGQRVELALKALKSNEPSVRLSAAKSLKAVLANIKPTVFENLSSDLRRQLYAQLGRTGDHHLDRVIVNAARRSRDLGALPYVRSLLECDISDRVRELANRCITFLEDERERIEDESALLRPSSSASADSDLLRSTTLNAESDSEVLLRPGEQ